MSKGGGRAKGRITEVDGRFIPWSKPTFRSLLIPSLPSLQSSLLLHNKNNVDSIQSTKAQQTDYALRFRYGNPRPSPFSFSFPFCDWWWWCCSWCCVPFHHYYSLAVGGRVWVEEGKGVDRVLYSQWLSKKKKNNNGTERNEWRIIVIDRHLLWARTKYEERAVVDWLAAWLPAWMFSCWGNVVA